MDIIDITVETINKDTFPDIKQEFKLLSIFIKVAENNDLIRYSLPIFEAMEKSLFIARLIDMIRAMDNEEVEATYTDGTKDNYSNIMDNPILITNTYNPEQLLDKHCKMQRETDYVK